MGIKYVFFGLEPENKDLLFLGFLTLNPSLIMHWPPKSALHVSSLRYNLHTAFVIASFCANEDGYALPSFSNTAAS